MFELDSGIREWRRALLGRGVLRAQDVDELEDHVREEYERLRATNGTGPGSLSAEESFLIATRRLGRPDALAAEFAVDAPLETWRRPWIWILGGYVAFDTAYFMIKGAVAAALNGLRLAGSAWLTAVYFAMVVLGVAGMVGAARWIHAHRGNPIANRALVRRLLTTQGIVGLTILALGARAATFISARGYWLKDPNGAPYYVMSRDRLFTANLALTLVPIILLAAFVWCDRARLREATFERPQA